MSTKKPKVIGGKLRMKGSNPTPTVKKRKLGSDSSESSSSIVSSSDKTSEIEAAAPSFEDHLTETQKKHLLRKQDIEARAVKSMTGMTFRERVEVFNHKLNIMTEHNDLPRISAAGNG